MAKFPKNIYVTHENEGGDDDFLAIHEEVPDVDNSTAVGIYQLVQTAEIVVTREVKKQKLIRT